MLIFPYGNVYTHTYMNMCIYVYGGILSVTSTKVGELHTNSRFDQLRMYACMERPTERGEACLERSDDGRDCKLHMT